MPPAQGSVVSTGEVGASIKEFAEKYMKAYEETFLTRDLDALERLEDPDMVHHSVARGQDTLVGLAAHKQTIANMLNAIPDYVPELRYLTGADDIFAISYKARGTFTGTAPGFSTPTGKEVTLDYLYLFRVHEGRIAEGWYKGSTTGFS